MDAPPERIELDDVGVVLRRHRTDDLEALHAAIEESRDHLRPFMPWADQTRADTAAFLAGAIEQWERGSDFGYLITDADSGEVLGGCGIHRRLGDDALEIGYWLRVDGDRPGRHHRCVGCPHRRRARRCRASNGWRSTATRRTGAAPPCPAASATASTASRPTTSRRPATLGRSMIWVHAPPRP